MSVLPILPVSDSTARPSSNGSASALASVKASAGQAATHTAQTTNGSVQAGQLVQAVSAQAVQALIKLLSRPLSGTSLPVQTSSPAPGPATAAQLPQAQLPVQLTVDGLQAPQTSGPSSAPSGGQSGGESGRQTIGRGPVITTTLPLPAGTQPPDPGSAIRVSLGAAGSGEDLVVDVLRNGPPKGTAPQPQQQLRADLARQTSPAPLMADLLSLPPTGTGSKGLDAAITRVLGHVLNANPSPEGPSAAPRAPALAQGLERSLAPLSKTATPPTGPAAQAGSASAPEDIRPSETKPALPATFQAERQNAAQPRSQGGSPGLQGALSALVRALGLAVPDATTGTASSSTPRNATPTTPGNETATTPAKTPANLGGQPLKPPSPGQAAAAKPPTQTPAPPTNASTGQQTPAPAQSGPSKLPAQPLSPPPDLSDPAQLRTLLSKADGALARMNAMTSLSAESSAANARTELAQPTTQVARLDLPMLIGQEVAVLGIAIDADRDPDKQAPDEAPKSWRFRFAFEARSAGGVEGVVALQLDPADQTETLDIGVWASDEVMLGRLEADRHNITAHLKSLGLHVASLTIAQNKTEAPTEPGQSPRPTHIHALDVRS